MHLVTFRDSTRARVGILLPDSNEIVDLAAAAPDLPRDMLGFISAGPSALARAQSASGGARTPLSSVKLLAPLPSRLRKYCSVNLALLAG